MLDILTAKSLIDLTVSGINLFDKVAGQVVKFIRKTPDDAGPPKGHQFKVGGKNEEINVESHGRVIQTITAEDLKNLPPEAYTHIKTLEKSLKQHYSLWSRIYPHRNDGSVTENAKVDLELEKLVTEMKGDLLGIIDFLRKIGVHLDDHYLNYRDVIEQYDDK